jgi:hypothetical protein
MDTIHNFVYDLVDTVMKVVKNKSSDDVQEIAKRKSIIYGKKIIFITREEEKYLKISWQTFRV